MPRPLPALVLTAALTFGFGANAQGQAQIATDTYTVTGNTLAQVQADMDANGPQGFWAYTTWAVNWTADCDITITAQITLPNLAPDAGLSLGDRAEFDRMLAALSGHEHQHVDFAHEFAAAVAAQDCPADSDALLQPILAREREFDAETDHGRTQGVYLTLN